MKSFLNALIFNFLLLFFTFDGFSQSTSILRDHDLKILAESFVPLNDSILVSNDTLNEFKPFYDLAKKKSVVAIGEATHGTDEIRKIQLILSKGLIENSGFKAISLTETPLLDSFTLFDFVVNGNGNIKEISSIFHFDILNFLTWLKNINSGKEFKQKIFLLGAGVDTPEKTIDFVENHCKSLSISNATVPIEKLKRIVSLNADSNMKELDSLLKYKNDLIAILNTGREKSDPLNFKIDCMIRSLNFIPGNWLSNINSMVAYQRREKIMIDNFEWMFELKGKTAIIFTHNFHTNKKTILTDIFLPPLKCLGEHLFDKFGEEYFSIGTEIQKGTFSNGVSNNEKIIEDKNKIGSIIGGVVPNNFGFLLFDEKVKNVVNNTKLKITNGTFKSSVVDCRGLIGEAFDGLIYIKSSNPYTLFNKRDFSVLYLNLETSMSEKIISSGKLSLSARYDLSKSPPLNAVSYSIYLNDENKKVIDHYDSPIERDGQQVVYDIPKNTKYISISIVLKKLDYFRLTELKVNSQSQSLKKINLYDWNKIGYKIEYNKGQVLITK